MQTWEISIIEEFKDGYLVMAPNGDTNYMSKEEYESYKNKKHKHD